MSRGRRSPRAGAPEQMSLGADFESPIPASDTSATGAASRPSSAASLAAVTAMLRDWERSGALRTVDLALAAFVSDADTEHPTAGLVAMTAALCAHQFGRGHTCLDLEAVLEDAAEALDLPPDGSLDPQAIWPGDFFRGLTLAEWRTGLLGHPAVAVAQDVVAARQPSLAATTLTTEDPDERPLVLDGSRVYLRRNWRAERAIATALAARAEVLPVGADPVAALQILFPAASTRSTRSMPSTESGAAEPADAVQSPAAPDWQKLACALALRSRVCVITGGPGTGKTTTVTRLLALLQAQALAAPGGRPLRVRLAAPTGKAAARLNESIRAAVGSLALDGLADADAVRASLTLEAGTLHRLLGRGRGGRGFRHDAREPLGLDLLVVDEASMIDLELFAAMLAALPPAARLVLLGDRDQLASVEAGAVLGELCRDAREGRYTPATATWWCSVTGEPVPPEFIDADGPAFDQAVVMLRVSRRFDGRSPIGRLAAAVNAGDTVAAAELWAPAASEGLARMGLAQLAALAAGSDGYQPCLALLAERRSVDAVSAADADDWARRVLDAFGRFRVLCALRSGDTGVDTLNEAIATALAAAGLLAPAPRSEWFAGRPVMVTRNDYELGLMNGDIGITLARRDAQGRERLWVVFPGDAADEPPRWILPGRLTAVETVFAMTVHKSQGSEFDRVALVLPPRLSPILTRELLYTAITRARRDFILAEAAPGTPVFEEAMRRRVRRASGLAERLLGLSPACSEPPPGPGPAR